MGTAFSIQQPVRGSQVQTNVGLILSLLSEDSDPRMLEALSSGSS